MIDITNKSDYQNDSVYKKLIIQFEDGTEISNSNILSESMTLSEILFDDEQIHFGRCGISEFKVTIVNIAANLKDQEIKVFVDINKNRLPLGVFTIRDVEKTANKSKKTIIAMDKMDYIDVDVTKWYENLKFPMTLKNFRNSFFEYIGLQQEQIALIFDDIYIDNPLENYSQINGRTIIEGICEVNGVFGRMDRYGTFTYITLGTSPLYPSETLYPSEKDLYPSDGIGFYENVSKKYINAIYEDYMTTEIDKIIIVDGNGSQSQYGVGNNAYVINSNYVLYNRTAEELQNIAKKFLNQVNGIIYCPATINLKGLPYVEIGDRLYVETSNDTIETYVFSRTLSGIQSLRDKYESKGEEYLLNDLNSIQSKIENLNRETEKVKIDVHATQDGLLSKVEKGTVSSEISQEADQIVIKGNRLVVDSDNFNLTSEGNVTITGNIAAHDGIDFYSEYLSQNVNFARVIVSTEQNDLELRDAYNFKFLDVCRHSQSSDYVSNWYGSISFRDGISVAGTKSREIETKDFGKRLQYAYETPTPLFGDVGEGKTDETGICYIFLDDIFAETIDTKCEYQVFLQTYSDGNIFVEERNSSFFIVKGDANIKFGWEVKAVQKDYEMYRLENPQNDLLQKDYAIESYDYLSTLLYNVESEVI